MNGPAAYLKASWCCVSVKAKPCSLQHTTCLLVCPGPFSAPLMDVHGIGIGIGILAGNLLWSEIKQWRTHLPDWNSKFILPYFSFPQLAKIIPAHEVIHFQQHLEIMLFLGWGYVFPKSPSKLGPYFLSTASPTTDFIQRFCFWAWFLKKANKYWVKFHQHAWKLPCNIKSCTFTNKYNCWHCWSSLLRR